MQGRSSRKRTSRIGTGKSGASRKLQRLRRTVFSGGAQTADKAAESHAEFAPAGANGSRPMMYCVKEECFLRILHHESVQVPAGSPGIASIGEDRQRSNRSPQPDRRRFRVETQLSGRRSGCGLRRDQRSAVLPGHAAGNSGHIEKYKSILPINAVNLHAVEPDLCRRIGGGKDRDTFQNHLITEEIVPVLQVFRFFSADR